MVHEQEPPECVHFIKWDETDGEEEYQWRRHEFEGQLVLLVSIMYVCKGKQQQQQ